MKITAEEQLMYNVMKAIYESGIPISFKGSMVLKACLMEAGFTNDTRHTVDIDANWYSHALCTYCRIRKKVKNRIFFVFNS